MTIAYLMSRTKGEEAHKEYKEEAGSNRRHYEYFLCLLFYEFMHTSAI